MQRRTALAGVGLALVPLAGCEFSSGDPPATTSPTPPNTASTNPPTTRGLITVQSPLPLVVDVVASDSTGMDSDFAPQIEVPRPHITQRRSARIRVTLRNTSDQTLYEIDNRGDFKGLFPILSTDEELVLLPRSDYPADEGCWRAPLSEDELKKKARQEGVPNRGWTKVFEWSPGETLARDYTVYGSPTFEHETCLLTGEYRFEERIEWDREKKEEYLLQEPQFELTWGFTLKVESR